MGTLKDSIDISKDAIQAVGETPDGKKAIINVGKAAVTVTQAINNALLPLAAVNYGFEKAREYFSTRFASDLGEKTKNIPSENVTVPKASVAGPALQGLAFTHEEDELREMYLSLLATAMDNRISSSAHPAFVEIIKQLDAKEAKLLDGVLQSSNPIPAAEIQAKNVDGNEFNVLLKHLLPITGAKTDEASVGPRLAAMVENWVRLGLVEVTYSRHLAGDEQYDWVKNSPEYKKFEHDCASNITITFEKGAIERTQLGAQFALAVGIVKLPV